MKRIVLICGLISGAIFAIVMAVTLPLINSGLLGHSEILGYASMVLAFVMVFVGIRSYREKVSSGAITFGKAFQVGILITLISSAIYVVSWEVIYFNFTPDFLQKYDAHVIKKMRADGGSDVLIAAKQKQMQVFEKLYKNPLVNVSMTFVEVFPVGLVITIVSAAILRRRQSAIAAPSSVFAP